jgi:hypothetical protein
MSNKNKLIIYPKLPASFNLGFIRIGGSGLANCMFIASRAYVKSQQFNYGFIDPAWLNISMGPYLRKESDKRHYNGLFKSKGIQGLLKLNYLLFYKRKKERLIVVEGLGNYFEDLLDSHNIVRDYILEITENKILNKVDITDYKKKIGVHIRLGDYKVSDLNTKLDWYILVIQVLIKMSNNKYEFLLFSDGNDEELKELLEIPQVKRGFTGSALGDILALSKCEIIIGSDSTFSGWGAFLGQVPIVFPKNHFGKVLINQKHELILNIEETNNIEIQVELKKWLNAIN